MKKLFFTLIIASAGLFSYHANAQATHISDQQSQDMAGMLARNFCTGEWMTVTGGTLFTNVHMVMNNNKFSLISHVNVQNLTIVDAAGNVYTGNTVYNFAMNDNYNGAFAVNQPIRVTLATPGGGNNVSMQTNIKVIFNANWEITVELDEMEAGCQ